MWKIQEKTIKNVCQLRLNENSGKILQLTAIEGIDAIRALALETAQT